MSDFNSDGYLYGNWFNYRHSIEVPAIPVRMKNAIESELNSDFPILDIPPGINHKESIPAWLIVKWAESGLLMRLPNIGVKTYNDTLKAVSHCLSL